MAKKAVKRKIRKNKRTVKRSVRHRLTKAKNQPLPGLIPGQAPPLHPGQIPTTNPLTGRPLTLREQLMMRMTGGMSTGMPVLGGKSGENLVIAKAKMDDDKIVAKIEQHGHEIEEMKEQQKRHEEQEKKKRKEKHDLKQKIKEANKKLKQEGLDEKEKERLRKEIEEYTLEYAKLKGDTELGKLEIEAENAREEGRELEIQKREMQFQVDKNKLGNETRKVIAENKVKKLENEAMKELLETDAFTNTMEEYKKAVKEREQHNYENMLAKKLLEEKQKYQNEQVEAELQLSEDEQNKILDQWKDKITEARKTTSTLEAKNEHYKGMLGVIKHLQEKEFTERRGQIDADVESQAMESEIKKMDDYLKYEETELKDEKGNPVVDPRTGQHIRQINIYGLKQLPKDLLLAAEAKGLATEKKFQNGELLKTKQEIEKALIKQRGKEGQANYYDTAEALKDTAAMYEQEAKLNDIKRQNDLYDTMIKNKKLIQENKVANLVKKNQFGQPGTKHEETAAQIQQTVDILSGLDENYEGQKELDAQMQLLLKGDGAALFEEYKKQVPLARLWTDDWTESNVPIKRQIVTGFNNFLNSARAGKIQVLSKEEVEAMNALYRDERIKNTAWQELMKLASQYKEQWAYYRTATLNFTSDKQLYEAGDVDYFEICENGFKEYLVSRGYNVQWY